MKVQLVVSSEVGPVNTSMMGTLRFDLYTAGLIFIDYDELYPFFLKFADPGEGFLIIQAKT